MILKFKSPEANAGAYTFIDNVLSFSIEKIKGNPICPDAVFVHVVRKDDNMGLMLSGEAYLMNDSGQTIERLI